MADKSKNDAATGSPEPGALIGSYRVDALLARGGMGVVYRATDTRLNRPVAIKLLSATLLDASARRRFQREARMASALNHPHILTVHDVGDHAGSEYLVTELVDGGTLDDWRHAESRSWRQVAELLIGVADALAAAHAANILHRDIKPGNILVTRSGYAKLADFGLAKPATESDRQTGASEPYTRAGVVIGTVAYMSPEQIAGRALDARSDVFAFGVVLYEMLARRRPFDGDTDVDVMHAVTHFAPDPLPGDIPDALRTIVDKAIEKDPAERYQSMRDLVVDLRRVARRTSGAAAPMVAATRTGAPPSAAAPTVERSAAEAEHSSAPAPSAVPSQWRKIVAVIGVFAVLGAAYFVWNRTAQARWAREEAIPTISRLTDEGKYGAAFELAQRARRYAPDDSLLGAITPYFTATYAVSSTPPGADVFVRSYGAADETWQPLGRTPLPAASVARRPLRWRFEKQGFETAELASAIEDDKTVTNAIEVTLQPLGTQPGMVFVPGGAVNPSNGPPLQAQVASFFIDRYEVTNADYKEFVAAGGYERRSYWAGLDFEKDGTPLAWEDAMRLFVDTTGRAGPAAWELGNYPAGQGRYPVAGVSWYEAVAYARFRDKVLPTAYHWSRAALPGNIVGGLAASIVPASNYASNGVAAVGTYQGIGPFGTYDMYGNVSEWAWNRDGAKRAWTLGGNWQDAPYNFSLREAHPLLERSPSIGFRLAHDMGTTVPAALLDPIELLGPPTTPARRPVSDEVFAAYAQQFAYRTGELHVAGPVTVETTDDWVKQRVTLDTGYGERMDLFLFVPSRARPPFQTLVYFPPFDAIGLKLSSADLQPGHPSAPLDFIVKSGRMFVHPIYQGTYERYREPLDFTDGVALQRRWVDWRSDMGRVLDYLQTRGDVDAQRLGYISVSFGSIFPLHLVALNERFRAAVLLAGGMSNLSLPPPIDPTNYAARIKIPVLLMNGRFDYTLPIDSQNQFFELLGTPPEAKRHVLVDSGHIVPRSEILRASLGWLDENLGPVR